MSRGVGLDIRHKGPGVLRCTDPLILYIYCSLKTKLQHVVGQKHKSLQNAVKKMLPPTHVRSWKNPDRQPTSDAEFLQVKNCSRLPMRRFRHPAFRLGFIGTGLRFFIIRERLKTTCFTGVRGQNGHRHPREASWCLMRNSRFPPRIRGWKSAHAHPESDYDPEHQ